MMWGAENRGRTRRNYMVWLDKLGTRWERLPEIARWILFLPALFAVWIAANLLVTVAFWMVPLGWPGKSIRRMAMAALSAAFSAQVFFPLQFYLAPRARVIIGWCFYSLFMLVSGLVVVRAVLFLVPDFIPAGTWESQDWDELAQSCAWIVAGTQSFWSARREQIKTRRRFAAAVSA